MRLRHLICLFALIFLADAAAAEPVLVPGPPRVNASSSLVMDFYSGHLIAAENIDQKTHPASLTKIMTIYVVASELAQNNISMDDMVTVSEKAWKMTGSRMFIEVNKQVSVHDLIMGVIVQSGNDASVALAEHVSGDETVFAELMNRHAERLGLANTHFVNSSGFPDERHYTTARDIALLVAALIRDFPDIYHLHSLKEFTYNGIRQQNRNRLLWIDGTVDGVKTGHTEAAGYCLAASAKRDDMRLITIVMGANGEAARTEATQAMLNYGFRFYETRKIFSAYEIVTTAKVWKGTTGSIDLGLKEDLYVTVPRGHFDNLNVLFDLPQRIIAPVAEGQKQGSLKLMLSDREILQESLYAMNAIEQAGLMNRLRDDIRLMFE